MKKDKTTKTERHNEEEHACEIIELGDVEFVHNEEHIHEDMHEHMKKTIKTKQNEQAPSPKGQSAHK